MAVSRRAVFLDKDGTLVENVPYNVDPDRIRLVPGAGPALRLLGAAGFRFFVVSNQSGVARGLFEELELAAVEACLRELMAREGVALDGFYYCPHHPDGTVAEHAVECLCRKPQPGLLLHAAAEHGVDLAASWLIGDILDDVQAGHAAGCATVLVNNGGETEWMSGHHRTPDIITAGLPEAARAILALDGRGGAPAPGS